MTGSVAPSRRSLLHEHSAAESPLLALVNRAEFDVMRGLRTSLVKEVADSDLSSVAASLQGSFTEPAVGALCGAMSQANDWVAGRC